MSEQTKCARTACGHVFVGDEDRFFNQSTLKLYCQTCAVMLNRANEADAKRLYGGPLCVKESHQCSTSKSIASVAGVGNTWAS